MPFGMVKVGPDTSGDLAAIGFAHAAGYWYPDTFIQGFSHTHMEGTGVADYGNILFMPTVGMDVSKTNEIGYQSRFSHSTEAARPGYYAVTLEDSGIRVELTASERSAAHRYTFPAGAPPVVLIDVCHTLGTGECRGARIDISPGDRDISGWMINKGDFGPIFHVYFSAQFNRPIIEYSLWNKGELLPGQSGFEVLENGSDAGAYLGFEVTGATTVEAQVGLSYVSVEQARLNREREIAGKSFEEIRAAAENAWSKIMGGIEATGGSERERTIFYTALYHSNLMPTLFTDVDGRYVGLDKQIHQADGFRYYTDFSLWDTYHTLHSLLTLLAPDRQREMVVTLVKMYEQHGNFPRWPLASSEAGTMVGTPADIVIAESYLKGIREFDSALAYEGMKKSAGTDGPRGGIKDCLAAGFCPADKMGGSVSLTLEYAYADYAIARMARALGLESDHATYLERSQTYRNQWDDDTQFFRPKTTSGSWADPDKFNPAGILQDHYVEGNAWQYLWLVPYDVSGFIQLFGSRDAMLRKLDTFFQSSVENPAAVIPLGGTPYPMPDPYYWHGNEPDIHAAYMYTLAGRPDLAPRWIRWIMDTKYTDGPDGLPGNDDAGTLSAWYVFSAMGIYPLAGTDVYLIGSPVFGRSVLHLPDGNFVIEARNASPENLYIRSASLNGRPLREPWFRHADLASGGSLLLTMGSSPSSWGRTDPLVP